MKLISLVLTTLILFGSAQKTESAGVVVKYDWILKTHLDNKYSPDCMNDVTQGRYVFLVEGELPGPTIDVKEGDKVRVSQLSNNQNL